MSETTNTTWEPQTRGGHAITEIKERPDHLFVEWTVLDSDSGRLMMFGAFRKWDFSGGEYDLIYVDPLAPKDLDLGPDWTDGLDLFGDLSDDGA